jgi:hypothetical protein
VELLVLRVFCFIGYNLPQHRPAGFCEKQCFSSNLRDGLYYKEKHMKRWHGSCIGVFLVLLIGGGSLLFLVPFGGAVIIGMPALYDRLTAYVLCPDATDYSYTDSSFGQQTTTSPSGGTGHYTELTCTYKNGSQKTFPNEEVAIKGIAASGVLSAICGGVGLLFFVILAAIVGARLVRPKTV